MTKFINFSIISFLLLSMIASALYFPERVNAAEPTDTLYYQAKNLAVGSGTLTIRGGVTIPYQLYEEASNKTYSTDTTLGDATNDDEMVIVRHLGNMTINTGVTLTTTARKRGLVIYVAGNLVDNGTITMTGKGASRSTDATAVGQNILMIEYGGSNYELTATAAGAGGEGGYGYYSDLGYAYGGSGGASTTYASGGGGGGGALSDSRGFVTSGGNGNYDAGGTGAGSGAGGYGATGRAGTLILFVDGNITFSGATLSSAGVTGGSSNLTSVNCDWIPPFHEAGGGGGGSGGGIIKYFYAGTLTGSPTTNVAAGGGGGNYSCSGTSSTAGSSGTAGSASGHYFSGSPAVTSSAATGVTYESATLSGNITASWYSCTERGFVFDTSSHADPGNVAPASAGYGTGSSHIYTETGSFSEGVFTYALPLTATGTYYFRSYAYNSSGYDYSNTEQSFTTSALNIISPSSYTIGSTSVTTSTRILYGSVTLLGGYTRLGTYTSIATSTANFEYKKTTDTAWTNSTTYVMTDNGTYTCTLSGLSPAEYQFRTKIVTIIPYNNTYPYASGVTVATTYGDVETFTIGELTSSYVPIKTQWMKNIYPTGAGTSTSWTGTTGTPYQCIDDDWKAISDDDNIYTATDAHKSGFTFGDYTAGTTISKVEVVVRAKRLSSLDNVNLYIRVSGTDYDLGELLTTSTATYSTITKTYYTNPVTLVAWTTTDVTNMEWGVKKTGSVGYCYVSEMYVSVYPLTINDLSTLTNKQTSANLDITNLSNMNFCEVSGLDLYLDNGAAVPFTPGTTKILFEVPSISAGQTVNSSMYLSSTVSDNFYPTYQTSFADNAAFEPGAYDNFTVDWRGYVDKTDAGYLVNKTSSYGLNLVGGNSLDATVVISSSTKTVSDNLTSVSSGYHRWRMDRVGGVLNLYRDGMLVGSTAASGTIDDNGNALTINENGSSIYNDLLNIRTSAGTTLNLLPSYGLVSTTVKDNSQTYSGTLTEATNYFESWTESTFIGTDYVPSYSEEGGNAAGVVTLPGEIPGMMNTGTGEHVPLSTGGDHKIWGYDQFWVPAATAAGVSTNFLLSLIIVVLSIICALMFFTWFPSPIMTGIVLCTCLFLGSATGILPAWIGLLTAIAVFFLLIRAGLSGFN